MWRRITRTVPDRTTWPSVDRAGIKRVIVPDRNKADLEEVPQEIRDELEFVFVSKPGR